MEIPISIELLADLLSKAGYDGFYQPVECACKCEDLIQCGGKGFDGFDCKPGYLGPANDECDGTIGPKPKWLDILKVTKEYHVCPWCGMWSASSKDQKEDKEEIWLCDCRDYDEHEWHLRAEKAEAELKAAKIEAESLLKAIWKEQNIINAKPLDNVGGMISQINNAVAVPLNLEAEVKRLHSELIKAVKLLRCAEGIY